jgi:hypothetical protein
MPAINPKSHPLLLQFYAYPNTTACNRRTSRRSLACAAYPQNYLIPTHKSTQKIPFKKMKGIFLCRYAKVCLFFAPINRYNNFVSSAN